MHERIRAFILFDETITYLLIKPFYDSIRHGGTLLVGKKINQCFMLLQDTILTNGAFLQSETTTKNQASAIIPMIYTLLL